MKLNTIRRVFVYQNLMNAYEEIWNEEKFKGIQKCFLCIYICMQACIFTVKQESIL